MTPSTDAAAPQKLSVQAALQSLLDEVDKTVEQQARQASALKVFARTLVEQMASPSDESGVAVPSQVATSTTATTSTVPPQAVSAGPTAQSTSSIPFPSMSSRNEPQRSTPSAKQVESTPVLQSAELKGFLEKTLMPGKALQPAASSSVNAAQAVRQRLSAQAKLTSAAVARASSQASANSSKKAVADSSKEATAVAGSSKEATAVASSTAKKATDLASSTAKKATAVASSTAKKATAVASSTAKKATAVKEAPGTSNKGSPGKSAASIDIIDVDAEDSDDGDGSRTYLLHHRKRRHDHVASNANDEEDDVASSEVAKPNTSTHSKRIRKRVNTNRVLIQDCHVYDDNDSDPRIEGNMQVD
jgi:hypothetical protein